VNRALKFVSSQYASVLPESGDAPGPFSPNDPLDSEFITSVNGLLKDYIDAMDCVKIRLGLQTVMLISMRGNNYLQSSGLNKALIASNPSRCAQVISRAVNLIYTLSALIYPFMPATSSAILAQLNAPARAVPQVLSNDILGGHTIGTPEHLFKKIEDSMAEVWRIKFGGIDNAEVSAAATPDPLKAAPGQSKKTASRKAAPAASVVPDGPKSPEAISLETKVTEQGHRVRELKAKTPKTPEIDADIKSAVEVLKRLKSELEVALKQS
jgi:methionyl-tRNA synthetase